MFVCPSDLLRFAFMDVVIHGFGLAECIFGLVRFNAKSEILFGSREESEVVGIFVFSHIRMMGYFRLG